MVGVQHRKLNAAFAKAKAAHDDQFADSAAKFDAAVGAKAVNWSDNVGTTLSATGYRLSGVRGPASILARLGGGDMTFQRDTAVAPTGVIDPTVPSVGQVPYIDPRIKAGFKAFVDAKVIQYTVALLRGDVADATEINAILDRGIAGFLTDTGSVPPTSFLHFSTGTGLSITMHLENGDLTTLPVLP